MDDEIEEEDAIDRFSSLASFTDNGNEEHVWSN